METVEIIRSRHRDFQTDSPMDQIYINSKELISIRVVRDEEVIIRVVRGAGNMSYEFRV